MRRRVYICIVAAVLVIAACKIVPCVIFSSPSSLGGGSGSKDTSGTGVGGVDRKLSHSSRKTPEGQEPPRGTGGVQLLLLSKTDLNGALGAPNGQEPPQVSPSLSHLLLTRKSHSGTENELRNESDAESEDGSDFEDDDFFVRSANDSFSKNPKGLLDRSSSAVLEGRTIVPDQAVVQEPVALRGAQISSPTAEGTGRTFTAEDQHSTPSSIMTNESTATSASSYSREVRPPSSAEGDQVGESSDATVRSPELIRSAALQEAHNSLIGVPTTPSVTAGVAPSTAGVAPDAIAASHASRQTEQGVTSRLRARVQNQRSIGATKSPRS